MGRELPPRSPKPPQRAGRDLDHVSEHLRYVGVRFAQNDSARQFTTRFLGGAVMRKLCISTMVGLALAIGMFSMGLKVGANQVVIEPGWRYSDGYWNYWDPDDRAWYYTDGRNWY